MQQPPATVQACRLGGWAARTCTNDAAPVCIANYLSATSMHLYFVGPGLQDKDLKKYHEWLISTGR